MADTKPRTRFEFISLRNGSQIIQLDDVDTIIVASPGNKEVYEIFVDDNGVLSMESIGKNTDAK